MKQWEYNDVAVLKTDISRTIEHLDAAGLDGWEFTGLAEENVHYRIYLMKRPIGELSTPATAEAPKHTHSIRRRCASYSSCPLLGTPQEITSVGF